MAWGQPCDLGPNSFLKALYGKIVHEWHSTDPLIRFKRVAWNECFVKASDKAKTRLAAGPATYLGFAACRVRTVG